MTLRRWRIVLGTAGLLLMAFGAFRLVTQVGFADLLVLAGWLIAAVVVHDGVLSPLVIGVGTALTRLPPRGRRYVQGGLICAALVTVIALPLIGRRNSQPPAKALLLRNYAGNLTILLALIATATIVLYALAVARRGQRRAPEQHS